MGGWMMGGWMMGGWMLEGREGGREDEMDD